MNHICGSCGGRFSCNGGAGHPCNCGAHAEPRDRRRCPSCIRFERGVRQREQEALRREMERLAAGMDQAPQFNELNVIRVPVQQQAIPIPELWDPSKIPMNERCHCNKCEILW